MKIVTPSLALFLSVSAANAAISLSGPSVGAGWIQLGANYDFLDDQQTGDPASDIVGTASEPGFFTAFDNAGTPSLTDGSIAFRVRLDAAGGNNNDIKFDRNLWIGIDADLNGSIDAFIGVSTPGQSTQLGIYDAGTGANTSPSSTTIANAAFSYTASAANYDYRAVNYLSDGGTLNDLTPGGTDTDYYVSCVVSFADVAAFITSQLPAKFNATTPFTENTPIRYVLGTATQGNTLNQDLGGLNNLVVNKNTTTTWTDLGGFSPTITASGQLVPEVSSTLLALIGSVFGLVFHRRR